MEDSKKKKAEYLYQKYRGLMFYVAQKYSDCQDLIEDAVHESFSKVLRNLDGIVDVDSKVTKNYIAQITRNTTLNFIELQHFSKTSSLILDDGRSVDISVQRNPDEEIAVKDLFHAFVKYSALLRPDYANILYLRVLCNYSYPEICAILDITEINAKPALFTGLPLNGQTSKLHQK